MQLGVLRNIMESLDFQSVLDALRDKHRRRLLVALLEHNPQEEVTIPEGVDMGEADRELVKAQMYHTHLPRLDELGIIRWNRDENEVVKGPNFEEMRPLLELINDHADELPYDWL